MLYTCCSLIERKMMLGSLQWCRAKVIIMGVQVDRNLLVLLLLL